MSENESVMKGDSEYRKVSPWVYLPHLEGVFGLIRTYVWSFSSLLFKTLGARNAVVGYVNFLQLPLSMRALWAPLVERLGTFRQVVLWSLILCSLCGAAIGGTILMGVTNLWIIAGLFLIMVIVVSVLDISYMGYKMSLLTTKEIEYFVAIGNGFFRLGGMFASTVLVYLVGIIHTRSGSYNTAWGIILLAGAFLMFLGWIYLNFKMPKSHMDSEKTHSGRLTPRNYLKSYVEFFTQPGGWQLVFYFFFAVIGEGVLMGMKIPMFLDAPENGGLGMDLTAIGVMTPVVIGAMIGFGVYGGVYLKKHGLQKVFFWMGVWMFVPNLCMSFLALFPQIGMINYELTGTGGAPVIVYPWVLLSMVLETAGYAFSFACYKAFEALVSKSSAKHKGTFGAIIGSLNLLGLTLGSGLSGVIQESIGYFWLFNISVLVSIPAWIMILFMPVKEIIERSDQLDAEESAG